MLVLTGAKRTQNNRPKPDSDVVSCMQMSCTYAQKHMETYQYPQICSREGMPGCEYANQIMRSGALSFFWQHSQMLATEAAVRRKMFAAKMATKKIATIHWYPVCVPACHVKCVTWLTAFLSDIFTG